MRVERAPPRPRCRSRRRGRGATRTRCPRWAARRPAPRTDATKSCQLTVPPLTTVCCHAEHQRAGHVAHARPPRSTRCPASARTRRRTCRGRASDSSSSDTTTDGPSWADHLGRAAGAAPLPPRRAPRRAPAGRGGRTPPAAGRGGCRRGRGPPRPRAGPPLASSAAWMVVVPVLARPHVEEDIRHDATLGTSGGAPGHGAAVPGPAGTSPALGRETYPIGPARCPREVTLVLSCDS